jgi:hypothetical protein
LNVTGIVACAEDLAKRIARTAILAVADIGAPKIVPEKFSAVLRVVECVQKLRAELGSEFFWAKVLGHRKIHVLGADFAQLCHALRLIAVNQTVGRGECIDIDPIARRLVRGFGIAHQIRQARTWKSVARAEYPDSTEAKAAGRS